MQLTLLTCGGYIPRPPGVPVAADSIKPEKYYVFSPVTVWDADKVREEEKGLASRTQWLPELLRETGMQGSPIVNLPTVWGLFSWHETVGNLLVSGTVVYWKGDRSIIPVATGWLGCSNQWPLRLSDVNHNSLLFALCDIREASAEGLWSSPSLRDLSWSDSPDFASCCARGRRSTDN